MDRMSRDKTEAERKFWGIPELVETLLPFLDVKSTLCLAQCHQMTLKILQGTFDWNQFIQRSFPDSVQIVRYDPLDHGDFGLTLREMPERLQLVQLVGFLKMAEEDPKAHLKALLDLISARFPASQDGPRLLKNLNDNGGPLLRPQLVKVTCSRNETHTVSPLAFHLIKEVEEAFFGSTEHTIVGMVIAGDNKKKEDLRKIWEALEPEDSLDVESICGWSLSSFYKKDGEEGWRRLVDALMDINDMRCGCGGQRPILARTRL